jgi:type VII secretion-associated protein (TIGR03931 family)
MSPHRAIIEAGPATIRRLCCGAGADAESSEMFGEALGAIDDPTTLVEGRPVAVDSLWREALRSLHSGHTEGPIVVHPSWWSPWRVGVVTAAAETVAADFVARPRSWLLTRARPDAGSEAAAVVEIADRLVAICGADTVGVARTAEPAAVAEQIAGVVEGMSGSVVLIDAPRNVAGAAALATGIAGAVRRTGRAAAVIDDARLARAARADDAAPPPMTGLVAARISPRFRIRTPARLAAASVVLAAVAPAVAGVGRHGAPSPENAPTAFLVEGRVALTVPANWPAQRVVTGPGSARVQLTSPSDPEVALHLTQSPVAGETLGGAAERLRRAIGAEPAGVFVDFNPSGSAAGRPAVTYREVRAGHHVRWSVLLDGTVRISVGCQSRPGNDAAVREACEQAVRTAHAVG